MGREYGFDATSMSDAPDSGGSPTGAEAILYPWAVNRGKVVVQNHPLSGIDLYVRFNADAASDASATAWDAIVEPGKLIGSPDGLMVKSVAVYFSGAGTLGTNFTIRGWK